MRSERHETPAQSDERVGQPRAFTQGLGGVEDLFEQAPEAAVVLRTDGRIVRVNNEFTRMFGYEAEEVLHRRLDHLILPEALVEGAPANADELRHGGRREVGNIAL